MTEELKDEIQKMKEEMAAMKEQLKKQAQEDQEEVNIGKKGFRIEIGDDDLGGVDDTINRYLGSVMEGVAQNLKASFGQMTKGFSFDLSEVAHEMEKVKHDLEKNKHEIEKEVRKAQHHARRAQREAQREVRRMSNRMQPLSEEEMTRFYETAPNLASALSDEKKLRLLKALEDGPMYQKDLSESTDIKGGTFKHHMDALIEVKYIQQEAVRGRYLITQLGVEALKLSEMLFRRYIFITEEQAKPRGVDVEVNVDDEEIDEEINVTAETVDEMTGQNEEEEG